MRKWTLARGALLTAIILLGLTITLAANANDVSSSQAKARLCAPTRWRNLVLFSTQGGRVDRSFPDVNGDVDAITSDGQGGWFVSGTFTCVGTVKAAHLVHLDRHGELVPSWHAAMNAHRGTSHPVPSAMVRSGRTLFLGGTFGVEAISTVTGKRLWLVPSNGVQGVFSLAASPYAVYAGGDFSRVAGLRRVALAAFDPGSGRVLAWVSPRLKTSTGRPIVNAIALGGGKLYVGGDTIVSIAGQRRPGLAALSSRTGGLTSWVPQTARGYAPGTGVGNAETLLVTNGELISAGLDGWGVTNVRTGRIEPWMYRIRGVARTFAAIGNTVYLAGTVRDFFSSVDGKRRNNLAAIDVVTGQFTRWAPRVDRYVSVTALSGAAGQVLLGGTFSKSLN